MAYASADARGTINEALKAREEQIKAAEVARILVEERVDVTLPVQTQPVGAVHPVTALMNLMEDVFVAMGWEVAEGPELEAEWMNFDALNFIPDHPARTMTGHACSSSLRTAASCCGPTPRRYRCGHC